MKRLFSYFLLVLGMLCACDQAFAQNTSNKGTDFWTTWMKHINGTNSNMVLYITSDVNTTTTVSLANGTSVGTYPVTANTITQVPIPASAYIDDGNGPYDLGIHITSEKPVVVYAHIYRAQRSGATLVLPVNTLAKDYYAIGYTQNSTTNNISGFATFSVIATEDDTQVEIKPTAALIGSIPHPANTTFTISLKKGQVYQAVSATDLTGSHIRSVSSGTSGCKRIAVYSGSSYTVIGCLLNSGDNLFQQAYPTASWGKNFVTAPLSLRAYDIFRIVCADPTTKVTVNGTLLDPAKLQNKFYYELNEVTKASVITADKPIQVVQYAVTRGNGLNCTSLNNERIGDPEMIYLSPIEQGLEHITLYSPQNQNIERNFINVILPTAAVSSFKLDNNAYTGTFTAITNSAYSYTVINVRLNETHNLSANGLMNAIVYGFGDVESYGYAAGANVKNLNEYIVIKDPASATTYTAGCATVNYELQVAVPFATTQVKWTFTDLGTTQTINYTQPSATTLSADGSTTLYIYKYNKILNFDAGTHPIVASVFNPIADDCGSYEDIQFDLIIAPLPAPKFEVSAINCQAEGITFTDKSTATTSATKSWLWEFGDGQTSVEQNPVHIYTAAGNYNAKLTTINEGGCSATSDVMVVHVARKPTAGFNYLNPSCAGKEVTFNDLSVANEGAVTQWIWNFDDGAGEQTLTSGAAFTHVFTEVKTYHVTLKIVTDKGCTSEVFTTDVVVHPLPVVDFLLPEACLVDVAKFTNISTIADGSESQFTYEWDYGDGTKGYTADGSHRYSAATTFTVKLKVTSKDGCVFETSKPFELNGAFPIPKFNIPDQICSSDDLIMEDQSTVTPGKIVRYDVYYDYDRHPTEFVQYDKDHVAIPTDKKFVHNYGYSNSPAYTDYHIKVIVYSGSSVSCIATYDKPAMRVYANPAVTLDPPAVVCQGDAAFNIIPNTTFIGKSVFTGGAITADGLFDPAKAGPGEHTISYTYTADAGGCTYSQTFNIKVTPTPIITGIREFTILAGGQVTLSSLALSVNSTPLTYSWSPRAGLSDPTSPNPIASPGTDTKYTLTVQSTDKCPATAIFNVKVLQQPVVYNTFTPNNDGRNDTWVIEHLDSYPKATVEIFDRSGEKVYFSVGYATAWDGRYKGKELPVGAYYYIIDPKNGRSVISGSVTIIR